MFHDQEKRRLINSENEFQPLTDKEIDHIVRHQVMRNIFFKYNLMRVRMKISLKALMKMNTIGEHWLR